MPFGGIRLLEKSDCGKIRKIVYLGGFTNALAMKAALLIFFLFIGYNITQYLVNLVKMEAKGVKIYQFSAFRQISLLFYALLSAAIGSMLIYYAFISPVRKELWVAMLGLAAILLLLFILTFWMHLQYAAYQGESTLRFDPFDQEITLMSPRVKVRIRKAELAKAQWVRCYWPWMPWSEYEYMVLHLHNGSRLLLTSLLVPLPELKTLLAGKDVHIERRLICRIHKDF
jgi:hypothetical protein